MIRYVILIEHAEESYGAHVPDLPGCIAVGDTREEVLRLIEEAVALHIEALRDAGQPIPPAAAMSLRPSAQTRGP
jgi:predicted RNase H-like HicB family nuclease